MLRTTRRRLEELEGQVRAQSATIKALELEWTNVYDKLRQQASRLEKRLYDQRRRENVEEEEPQDPPIDAITDRLLQRRGRRHVRSVS
jgi:uncharacterized coiled-coil protein SlyX